MEFLSTETIAKFDWAKTPLGAASDWSSELKTAVKVFTSQIERSKVPTGLDHEIDRSYYKTLFNSIDQGFCVCELIFDGAGKAKDYRFLEINHVFEAMTGLTEAVGKTAKELVSGLEDFWVDTYAQVVLTGKSIRFENKSAPMGRWFDVSAFPIDDLYQHRFGLLFTNISDRKRQELNNNFLAEIQTTLMSLRTADEIMEVIGEKIGSFFNYSLLVFVDVDLSANLANMVFSNSDSDLLNAVGSYPLSDYLSEIHIEQLKLGRAVTISDIRAAADTRDGGESYEELEVGSLILTPHLTQGEWKFMLGGNRRKSYNWGQAEIELMQALTDRIYLRIERALAETALYEEVAELQAILDIVPIGIAIAEDANCDVIRVNGYAQAMLSVTPDTNASATGSESESLPFRQYRNGIEISGDQLPMQLASAQGIAIKDFEMQMVRADGFTQDWLVNAIPIFNEAGEVRSSVASIADVTRLKQIEADLRQSEELKDRILESSPDCIKLLNPDGQILYMNEGGVSLLEIDDFSKYLNRQWLNFWQDDRSKAEKALIKARAGEVAQFCGYCPTAKGTPKWWEVVISPIRNLNNQIEKLLVSSRDISDRHHQEQNANFLIEIQRELTYLNDPTEIMEVVGKKIRQFFSIDLLFFADIDADSDRSTVVYNNRKAELLDSVADYDLSEYLGIYYLDRLKAGNIVAITDTFTDRR